MSIVSECVRACILLPLYMGASGMDFRASAFVGQAAMAVEDCDDNGVPDDQELVKLFTASTPNLMPFHADSPQVYEFVNVPAAVGDVTITIKSSGEFDNYSERYALHVNGTCIGTYLAVDGASCQFVITEVVVAPEVFNAAAGAWPVIELEPSVYVEDNCISYVQVDIAYQAEGDCDDDGVLDVCEPDSDGDGIVDDCDNCMLPNPTQADCQLNGVGDACEIDAGTSVDCQGNGIPDECEMDAPFVSISPRLAPAVTAVPQQYIVTAAPKAITDVTLTVDTINTLFEDDAFDVMVNGNYVGTLFENSASNCVCTQDTLSIPAALFNNSTGADPAVELVARGYVVGCVFAWVQLRIEYGADWDCDNDGVLDVCVSQPDVDFDGVLDACDNCPALFNTDQADCNQNGVGDVCEIAAGSVDDCNGNDVPDACEGIMIHTVSSPILSPIYYGSPQDFVISQPPWAIGDIRMRFQARADVDAQTESLHIYLDGWHVGHVMTTGFGNVPCPEDTADIWVSAELFNDALTTTRTLSIVPNFNVSPPGAEDYCPESWVQVTLEFPVEADCDADGVLDSCATPVSDCNGDGVDDQCQLVLDCNENNIPDICDLLDGGGSDDDGNGMLDECDADSDGDGVIDALDNCALFNPAQLDCQQNGVGDVCELADGSVGDCDGNGVPDACDAHQEDCQNNQLGDSCDIADGTSLDCDENGVPDECEPDCDNNGVVDACDILGPDADCNDNLVLDACEPYFDCNDNGVQDICDVGVLGDDCNGNGLLDACEAQDDCDDNGVQDICDLAAGTLPDLNGNGVPDSCEVCTLIADCADLDMSSTRDDTCVFWSCVDRRCVGTATIHADMGGAFGQCEADGTVDGNDRFHVLNCFANEVPGGGAYPCADTPPWVMNVDSGGHAGSCSPDGVCDGNDVWQALNAFAGINSCSTLCTDGGSPRPDVGPAVVEIAACRISMVAAPQRVRPGQLFDVHIMTATALPDLRGYQLHVGTVGGRRGFLELVDIAVHERKDHPFAGQRPWQAFNIDTAQVVVGLDGAGSAVPAGQYLATYTYRASRHAVGRFTIELLYDPQDSDRRTFLFPTRSRETIGIAGVPTTSVMVQIR